MAVYVVTDASVTVGGTDLSDHISSVELNVEVETQDSTAMGDTWREQTAGLKTGTVAINWHQDFAASEVDATLWPLLGTSAAIVVKPTSAAVGATNPTFSFNAIVNALTPIAGAVGDLATQTTTWPVTGAVTRATS